MSKGNVQDIYVLSPMQQGMLFHSISTVDLDVYYECVSCTISNGLNVAAFKQAWQQIIDRHPVLRTAFTWENRDKPLQVVLRQVPLPWEEYDWRDLSPSEQQTQLQAYLQADRQRGFDLKKAPLMRLTLIHTSDSTYYFVWSNHHIILDGWSGGLIFKELFAIYQALCSGQSAQLESAQSFRSYISWLQKQEQSRAEAFWRRELQGFTAPTPLGMDRPRSLFQSEGDMGLAQSSLSTETTSALQTLARQHRLTLNALVQGTWGLLLSRYSEQQDIVFGVTSSGRPPDLPGVDAIIGMLVNTLPVRIQVNPDEILTSWLRSLQAHQVEMRQYEYSSLAQIQGWSEVPRGMPLFESIVIFENFPIDASITRTDATIQMRDVHLLQQANYPISFVAMMTGNALTLRTLYDRSRFDEHTVRCMLMHAQTLLEHMVQQPDASLASLLQAVPSVERVDIILAASFTVEPLLTPLGFWMDTLNIPARLEVAPYNQIFQQLLDPTSLLATNQTGANVVLLRLEDWAQVEEEEGEEIIERLEHNADDFLEILETAQRATTVPCVLCLCPFSNQVAADAERQSRIREIEYQIAQRAAAISNVYVLHHADIHTLYPVEQINDPFADEAGHIPYTSEYFAVLSTAIARLLVAIGGVLYRVALLDSDSAPLQYLLAQDETIRTRLAHAHHISQTAATNQMLMLVRDIAGSPGNCLYLSTSPMACSAVRTQCPDMFVLQLPESPDELCAFINHLWVIDTVEDKRAFGWIARFTDEVTTAESHAQ